MAFTVARQHTVFGNKRTVLIEVTADGAEDNVSSGLGVVEYYSIALQSAATANPSVALNVDSSATVSLGTLGMSGFASGDHFYVTVYGR